MVQDSSSCPIGFDTSRIGSEKLASISVTITGLFYTRVESGLPGLDQFMAMGHLGGLGERYQDTCVTIRLVTIHPENCGGLLAEGKRLINSAPVVGTSYRGSCPV